MTEPGSDLRDRRGRAKVSDCAKEFVLRVEGERSKASLHVRPEALDRVELRAVGREVDREAPRIEDRLADNEHLVDVEVVHDDDVAGIDPWPETFLHEAKKGRPVHGGLARHDLRLLAEADGADERDRLPRTEWPRAGDAMTAQRATVLTAHPGFDEGFVDEDEAAQVRFLEERAEFLSAFVMLGRVAFDGDERLFFRENPSRKSARWTAERLVDVRERFMSTDASSATVESGISATIAASNSASAPRIGERLPPPRGLGSSEFVSRCSRRIRLTVARPMPSSFAVSSYEWPSARARRTASRNFKGVITCRRDHACGIGSSGRGVSQVLRPCLRSR